VRFNSLVVKVDIHRVAGYLELDGWIAGWLDCLLDELNIRHPLFDIRYYEGISVRLGHERGTITP
jgi:hypothetical protein